MEGVSFRSGSHIAGSVHAKGVAFHMEHDYIYISIYIYRIYIYIYVYIYTVSQKKEVGNFAHNFGKC